MNLASRYEAEIMIYGFMRIPLGKFETSCAFLFSQIFFLPFYKCNNCNKNSLEKLEVFCDLREL